MVFELKQHLKLTQQLIMTPQLQQSIKLLQLSRLELVDAICQEMEQNPLLEEVTIDEEMKSDSGPEYEGVKVEERTREITGESGDGKPEYEWEGMLEDFGPVGVNYYREDAEAPQLENMVSQIATLTDHLLWQLNLSHMTDEEKRVGGQIIGNLDSGGYMMATIDEIAVLENVSPECAESILKKIQEFDPPGVAARNLQECLLLQIRYLAEGNSLAERIVCDHLKELETKNYGLIARKQKVPLDAILEAATLINRLDPRPGLIYNEEKPQYIVPDVYVVKVGDDYRIVLNDDGMPRLRISDLYRKILGGVEGNTSGKACKAYIRDKLQSATWLIKSIQQRQRTIYKVSESIVQRQKDFFDKGINFLKPMVLRDIADDVSMHESTISRVTTNKYIHTPRGIFELKYFFNSGISRTNGDDIASESVKEKIRHIISEEDHRKPYNDSQIVALLRNSNISIARRTVAKYREMMGIIPSNKRKKYF
ncbi:MAG: RNA polymerase factor sigma-54 [Deltaproteobacteria bacterium]|nr:RNA polymerase factor sigma-54 [Deltaproteobacteria bacterium]